MVQLSFDPKRFNNVRLFVPGFFVLIAVIVAFLVTRPSLDASIRIDLGKLEIDTVHNTSFALRNKGLFTLSIQPTSCSCGSTFSTNGSTTIKSGDKMNMDVTFHLFQHKLGPFKKEYRIKTNDLLRPFVVLQIVGEVVAPTKFTE